MTRGLVLLVALLLVVAAVLLATRGDGPSPAVPAVDDTRVEAAEAPVGPAPSPAPERAVPEAGIESTPNDAPAAGRLRLLVRDADGSPAGGMKVVVGGAASDGEVPIVHAETDADTGALAVPWERLTSWAAWARAERGYAEVRLVGIEPLRVEFGRDAPPPDPVVIDLPPTGRVVVEVRDVEGMPLPGRWTVVLSRWVDRHRRNAQTEAGRAAFERVPVGLELRAEMGGVDRRFLGPRSPGEEVVVTLVHEDRLVTGRAVDVDGAPIAGTELVARHEYAWVSARTDEAGGFAFGIPPQWEAGLSGSTTPPFVLEEKANPAEVPRRTGVVTSPAEREVHRLGDVVLLEPPLLVAGVVVTADASPVADASVSLGRRQGEHERYVWTLHVRTDENGRFVIPDDGSDADEQALRLRVHARGFVEESPVSFARGARDLRIEVDRASVIAGRVEADSLDGLYVYVLEAPSVGGRASMPIREDGTFSLPAPPGRWDVCVRRGTSSRIPLAVVRGVEVPPEGPAEDPRLDPWTVRTRTISISVVDAERRPVRAVWVELRAHVEGIGTGMEQLVGTHDGVLELLVPAAPVDLEVSAQGYCARRLRDVVSDRTVVLGDAPELEITVRGDRSRLPEGADLLVRMDRAKGASEQRRHRTAFGRFVALPATVRFELPAAGRWEVRLFARHRRDTPIVPFGAPRSVDVPADGPVPPFELTIAPDEIDAALRALAAAGR